MSVGTNIPVLRWEWECDKKFIHIKYKDANKIFTSVIMIR